MCYVGKYSVPHIWGNKRHRYEREERKLKEKNKAKKHIERVCNDHGRNVYCIGISVLSDDAEFLCCGKYFGTCHGSGKFYSAEGFDDDDDSKCSTSDHRDCVCRKRIRR